MKHTIEDKMFEQILTMLEKAGVKPRLDENARKLHMAIVEYSLSCWDCSGVKT